MASSDNNNLIAMEQPWTFRPTFSDPWFSEIFTKENQTITNALHNSLLSSSSKNDDVFSSFLPSQDMAAVHVHTSPSVSGGSDQTDVAPIAMPRRGGVPPSGRVTKRKSRASKRATTTFITADPANFRQMVQQVTGVRFEGQMPLVVKPEPQRPYISRFVQPGGGLPTTTADAFFVDGSISSVVAPPSTVVADGGAYVAGVDFESFCSFPTLESSRVM